MKTKITVYTSVIFIVVFFLSTIIDFRPPYSSDSVAQAPVVAIEDIDEESSYSSGEDIDEDSLYKSFAYTPSSASDISNVDTEPMIESMSLDPPYKEDSHEENSSDLVYPCSMEEAVVGLPVLGVGIEPMDVKDLIREIVMENRYDDIGISLAKSYVNIRKEANADSEALGKLYRGAAGKVLDIVDDWYLIESGAVKGYVSSSYLETDIPYKELLEKHATISASINVDGLNVREKPDAKSKKITVIYLNEEYPVVDVMDDWIKIDIKDENISGYISRDYVEIIARFDKAISKEEEEEILRLQEEQERLRLLEEERIKKETEIKYREESPYNEDDLKLLSCLIHSEAGNQSYEGRLAVANVVLNRMKSSKYPKTMKEVIYQPGQFTVARSGSLEKQLNRYDNYSSSSQRLTIEAAKDALDGANNVGDRLYFHAYRVAVKKGYDVSKKNAVKIEDQLFW